jgi:hypothetical protein
VKALRFESYGSPSVLQFQEIGTPELKPDEELVKVLAAGVTRIDVAAVSGALKSKLPCTPGREFAGRGRRRCPQGHRGLGELAWIRGDPRRSTCRVRGSSLSLAFPKTTQPLPYRSGVHRHFFPRRPRVSGPKPAG